MSLLHSSTRRPAPLQDEDYDHEINLIDHTKQDTAQPTSLKRLSRSRSPNGTHLTPEISDSSSRRHSDVPLRKHATPQHLRKELTRRKYAKYQDRGVANVSDDEQAEDADADPEDHNEENGNADDEGSRGRAPERRCIKGPKGHKEPKSAIDILYENQRGGFLCGMPLFSSKALGNLDPSPWTNVAHKTSPTDITNAQVPDPSWEWAWKEWTINHENDVDSDGWEYSFAFSKKFSWHGPKWWNSFVRRRAWIRKRVKKHSGYEGNNAHMLNPDYFTIHSAQERSRSRGSSVPTSEQHRLSFYSRNEAEENIVPEDISDIGALMKALRQARIDREKTEAIESFIAHGGDDLYYLRDHMHEIMRMFIFQASRRSLLTHLLRIFNEAAEKQKEVSEGEKDVDPAVKRRYDNLEAAVQHADEEVKRLEFWSDVKDMAEKGETKGAVDESQGWDSRWTGLDGSGPKEIWGHKIAGLDDCDEHEGNGTAKEPKSDDGKGKAKE
ncbi:uncharacterized protein LY89DRAFT_624284 [Mollisia scopiformis]|uniref:Meiotically up-regulated 65 protein n=1 Tax=Mollisia scopiformis TaxID=149040 RepID=A0A194WWE1_MOLSC|nr:uncharacterized protein LY89DRAFT_624284 [Mollisia scopiformis]KUJ11989.1 hypothetical protein LY89DRAFT_624284 [Mollisia scopiformis]